MLTHGASRRILRPQGEQSKREHAKSAYRRTKLTGWIGHREQGRRIHLGTCGDLRGGRRRAVTTFGTFLRAVWGDSLARMSGPASVPFTGLALYVDQATSK